MSNSTEIAKTPITRDLSLVQIARELAIDHLEIEQIQELYKLSQEEWRIISQSPRFRQLLEQEITNWQTATNTLERTKLKAGAMIENWLPEAHGKLHDTKETLNSKTELAKLIARIAGLDKQEVSGSANNGFSVTINLGENRSLSFDKGAPLPAKVIEG